MRERRASHHASDRCSIIPGYAKSFRWGSGMLKPVMIVEPFELRSLGRANAPCLPRFHGDLFDGSLDSQLAELESVLATV